MIHPSRSTEPSVQVLANKHPWTLPDGDTFGQHIPRRFGDRELPLNLLADYDDTIVNRRAWETGLAAIRGANQARNVILSEPDTEPSLMMPGIIISCIFNEQGKLIFRAAPLPH